VQGEVKQLVEVKLSVVQSSHALPKERVIEHEPSYINDLAADTLSVADSELEPVDK
jgi:hypothetical protein